MKFRDLAFVKGREIEDVTLMTNEVVGQGVRKESS